MKDNIRLWNYFRSKETKYKGGASAICAFRLDHVLEGKNAIKNKEGY